MYLETLNLWNFRKFGSLENSTSLDLDKPHFSIKLKPGLNIFVGENDSGKSSAIDAIKLLLKTHSGEWISLKEEDFFQGAKTLRIECIFKDLRDEEASCFLEWLSWDEQTKTPFLKIFLQASLKERIISPDIRAGNDKEGTILPAEVRELLRTTYLKPLRDATNELVPRRNSRLSQILKGRKEFIEISEDRHPLIKSSICLNCLIKQYFDSSYQEEKCPVDNGDACLCKGLRNSDGYEIFKTLNTFLNDFFGTPRQATFEVNTPSIKSILETLRLAFEDEKAGLGTHNILFIATELLNLIRKDFVGLKIGLIEEIEAHIHPQAQMRIISHLQNLCSKETDLQLIISTHSPNIASKVLLENIFLFDGERAFSLAPEFTNLQQEDYRFLECFLDVTKANLFFAHGLILVEGWAEQILLPVLAKKIDIDLTQKGISIINVGGVAFLRYVKIFQRKDNEQPSINIPISVVTDLDVKPDEYEFKTDAKDKKTSKDCDITQKIKEKEDAFNAKRIKTFVSPAWTLEYCLAKNESIFPFILELSQNFLSNQAYKELTEKIKQNPNDKACILIQTLFKNKVSKTQLAYDLANRIESADTIDTGNQYTQYLFKAIRYAADF